MTFADRIRAAAVSCFGLGYSPFASGTVGTVGAVAIAYMVYPFQHESWFHFGAAMGCLAVLGLVLGVALGRWAEKHYGRKDPSAFVLDELVGYWVALLRLQEGVPCVKEVAVAFFAFRLFDVIKPWPARRIESWPYGWGIMLDDVVAGLYSLILVSTLREYLQWP